MHKAKSENIDQCCGICGSVWHQAKDCKASLKSQVERTVEFAATFATPPDNPHTTPMQANDRQVGGLHYKSPIQHWDYVLANSIPYLEAQVIKYLTRWRKKNGKEDVAKAIHYLQKLAEAENVPWPKAPETAVVPDINTGAEPGRGYVNQDR